MVSKDPEAAQPRGQTYATFSRAGRGKGSKGRGRGASCRVGSGAISLLQQGGEWPCFSKRRLKTMKSWNPKEIIWWCRFQEHTCPIGWLKAWSQSCSKPKCVSMCDSMFPQSELRISFMLAFEKLNKREKPIGFCFTDIVLWHSSCLGHWIPCLRKGKGRGKVMKGTGVWALGPNILVNMVTWSWVNWMADDGSNRSNRLRRLSSDRLIGS